MELQTLQEALKVEIQVHQVSGILSCVTILGECSESRSRGVSPVSLLLQSESSLSSVRSHGAGMKSEFLASPSCSAPEDSIPMSVWGLKVSIRGKGGSAVRGGNYQIYLWINKSHAPHLLFVSYNCFVFDCIIANPCCTTCTNNIIRNENK